MSCGIYKIINCLDQKVYIGSSVNITKRLQIHKCMLNGEYHDNQYLQNAFSKYGLENFSFEIIELCGNDDLVTKENFYIKLFNSDNPKFGYNLATVSEDRKNRFNHTSKVKMSKHKMMKNGNFALFKLINIDTNKDIIFDNLVDAGNYLIENKFCKTQNHTKVQNLLSICLRGKIVNNGKNGNGSIRKTLYKHKWEIIT